MKLPCNVTRDLLPLYHDGVCSEESRTLVEEHLGGCNACKKVLDDLSSDPPAPHVDDTAALKALKKQWGKSLAKSFAKGLALACLVCTVLWGAWYGLVEYEYPAPADTLQIGQVSQLSTGDIVFTLDSTDGRDIRHAYVTFDHKQGADHTSAYIVPMRSIYERKLREVEKSQNKHMFNLRKWNSDPDVTVNSIEITAIYVGPEDGGILIWEKGMELPPASQEMEEYFKNFPDVYFY